MNDGNQVYITLGKVTKINKYNSICEASSKTGINASHISECINSKRKSAGGFIWIIGIN